MSFSSVDNPTTVQDDDEIDDIEDFESDGLENGVHDVNSISEDKDILDEPEGDGKKTICSTENRDKESLDSNETLNYDDEAHYCNGRSSQVTTPVSKLNLY